MSIECPKCGRDVPDGEILCPACDFIVDTRFVMPENRGADRSRSPRKRPNPRDDFGEALILGDFSSEFQAIEGGDVGVASTSSPRCGLYVSGPAQAILSPDAIPALVPGIRLASLRLSPFEHHLVDIIDGMKTVQRIHRLSGMEEVDVRTTLAMLADKGIIRMAAAEAQRSRPVEGIAPRSTPPPVPQVQRPPRSPTPPQQERVRHATPPPIPAAAYTAHAPQPAHSAHTGKRRAIASSPHPTTGSNDPLGSGSHYSDDLIKAVADDLKPGWEQEITARSRPKPRPAEKRPTATPPPLPQVADPPPRTPTPPPTRASSTRVRSPTPPGTAQIPAARATAHDNLWEMERNTASASANVEVVQLPGAVKNARTPIPAPQPGEPMLPEGLVMVAKQGASTTKAKTPPPLPPPSAEDVLDFSALFAKPVADVSPTEFPPSPPPPPFANKRPATQAEGEPAQWARGAAFERVPALEPQPFIPPAGASAPDPFAQALAIANRVAKTPVPGPPPVPFEADAPVAQAPRAPTPYPPVSPTADASTVSPEMRTKARKIFEQAQKDAEEGNYSSARMNAKLATIYDPSEPRYRAALEEWMNPPQPSKPAKKGREVILFEQAQSAEVHGDFRAAVSLLEQAIKENPDVAAIHNRLGVILATRLKSYNKAIQALEKAIELDPDNFSFKNNLGKVVGMASSAEERVATRKSGTGWRR